MNNNSQKIPEFLLKLKKLVDSPTTDKLIYWNQDGKGFSITNGHQLAKEYFPYLFKHKNIFSFIRQLNMYGFHKINRIELGTNNNKGCCDDSEWSHPHFIRNRAELLHKIQRKISANLDNSPIVLSDAQNDPFKYELCMLKSSYRHLRNRDQIKMNKISDLERQNESIKKELSDFRLQMESQSSWINEIYGSLSGYFPENFKNALIYNGPPTKRNLLAIAPPTYKSNMRNTSYSNQNDSDVRNSQMKIRKIELSIPSLQIKKEKLSEYPLEQANPDLFIVDDPQMPPQEYDVDELLNNCQEN